MLETYLSLHYGACLHVLPILLFVTVSLRYCNYPVTPTSESDGLTARFRFHVARETWLLPAVSTALWYPRAHTQKNSLRKLECNNLRIYISF